MKKAKYLVFLVGVLPLVACSNSFSIIPEGGSSVAVADGAAVLKKAVASTSSDDKFGLNLSGFEFSARESSYSAGIVYSANSLSYSFSPMNESISISNASASLMAQGLTAADGSKFKAALTAKADVSYAYDVSASNVSAEVKGSQAQSGVTGSLYVSNEHVYFDASSPALASLITGFPQTSSSSGMPAYAFSSGKYVISVLSDDAFPVFSSSAVSWFQNLGNEVASAVSQYSTYFHSVKYSDGSYGLSISLTKADLEALIWKINGGSASSPESLSTTLESEFSGLAVTSLSAGVVFTASGIKTLKADIDVSFARTLGDELSGQIALSPTDAAKKVSLGLKIKGTLDVLTGDAVTVTIPDLSSYVVETK